MTSLCVTPPFCYFGEDPSRKFVPLDYSEEMSMEEILQKHPKGKGYGHILDGCKRYPLIVDANDQVLSFPPIINGELTSVTKMLRICSLMSRERMVWCIEP